MSQAKKSVKGTTSRAVKPAAKSVKKAAAGASRQAGGALRAIGETVSEGAEAVRPHRAGAPARRAGGPRSPDFTIRRRGGKRIPRVPAASRRRARAGPRRTVDGFGQVRRPGGR